VVNVLFLNALWSYHAFHERAVHKTGRDSAIYFSIDAGKPMVSVEVKLSDWLYRAVTNLEVLTLHRDYFRLDGGIERRVYELCRKHCGNQETWSIHLPLLYKKSGAQSPLRVFRFMLRKLVQFDHLPEYWLRYTESSDKLTVYPRTHSGRNRASAEFIPIKPLVAKA
jgi:plasmid replication initiation protein